MADPAPASSFFNQLNQALPQASGTTNTFFNLSDEPTAIISRLLPYVFVFSGLILFGMLIMGGFEYMFGAGDPKSAEAGKTRITNAFIGFIIIFLSYWITQLAEVIFGLNIF